MPFTDIHKVRENIRKGEQQLADIDNLIAQKQRENDWNQVDKLVQVRKKMADALVTYKGYLETREQLRSSLGHSSLRPQEPS